MAVALGHRWGLGGVNFTSGLVVRGYSGAWGGSVTIPLGVGGSVEDEVEQQSVTEQGSFIYGGHFRSTPMVAPLSHPGPFTLAGPRVTIAPTTFHPVPSSSPSSRPPQLLPSPSQISASQLISGLGS